MKDVSEELKESELKSITVAKVDPVEYGLEMNQAKGVEEAFKPMLEKMSSLEVQFNLLRTEIKVDGITKDIAKKAGALLSQYVKARTGTAAIHKEQKSFSRQYGLFVDGFKNAQLMAAHGIEPELKEIRDYIKLAAEKIINDNQAARAAILLEIDPETFVADNLGQMTDDSWDIHLLGFKAALEIREKESKRLIEEEAEEKRVLDLQNKRVAKCSKIAYLIDGFETIDFGSMSDEKYNNLVNDALNKRLLQTEEAAYSENKAFDEEKILTDKADLFLDRLLKDGYTKRRFDYIKDEYTISYDSLKTFNKREFGDLLKRNNDLIKAKKDKIKSDMMILEIAAHGDNLVFDKKAKEAKEDAEAAAAALAPDKEKLHKFSDDLLLYISENLIELSSEDAKDIYNEVVGSVMRIAGSIKAKADTL